MKVLLVSLPGIYPSFPAVGLEMVAQAVREKGHAPAVINGHLEMVEYMDERLLRTICQQNVWDLFYAFLVYPTENVGLRSKTVLQMLTSKSHSYQFTQDDLVHAAAAISRFNRHLLNRIAAYRPPFLIGFNVQNHQLLSAKFFARQAKAMWGQSAMTLIGGASVRDGLGESIVTRHAEFDFVSEEDGVLGIDRILSGKMPVKTGGFFCREGYGESVVGETDVLRNGPIREFELNYADFYRQRKRYEKKCDFAIFHPWDGLPAMLATGCRWSRCRFCNLREKHKPFSIGKVCDSIRERSRMTGVSKVFLLDLSQPGRRDLQKFFEVLENRQDTYLFGAMLRCDIDKRHLIRFGKNGLDICHLGIESYSDRLLNKMKKGVGLIDIAKTLIACVEAGIRCEGNLLLNLPWEKPKDIVETGRNLTLLSHLPLPRLIGYKLSHGSIEYNSMDPVLRSDWIPETEVLYAFPPRLRNSVETMYYSNKKVKLEHEALWMDIIKKYKRYVLVPPYLLYEDFCDGLLFHDSRDTAVRKRWHVPGAFSARLYRYCSDIRTIGQIERHFPSVSKLKVSRYLSAFVSRKVMMQSGKRFLSIALRRT